MAKRPGEDADLPNRKNPKVAAELPNPKNPKESAENNANAPPLVLPTKDIWTMNAECEKHSSANPVIGTPNSVPIFQRLVQRGFHLGVGDHVLGMLILKSSPSGNLAGVIVVGAVGIPNLRLCQSHQEHNNKPLMKMSFATSTLVEHFKRLPGFIPDRFLATGFFDHMGYAIAACSTLNISNCLEYFLLSKLDNETHDHNLFPAGGAIAPQPKSFVEEEARREELQNSIDFIKGFDGLLYKVVSNNGHEVSLKVRLEVEEMEIPDMELFEKLLSVRVVETHHLSNSHSIYLSLDRFSASKWVRRSAQSRICIN